MWNMRSENPCKTRSRILNFETPCLSWKRLGTGRPGNTWRRECYPPPTHHLPTTYQQERHLHAVSCGVRKNRVEVGCPHRLWTLVFISFISLLLCLLLKGAMLCITLRLWGKCTLLSRCISAINGVKYQNSFFTRKFGNLRNLPR